MRSDRISLVFLALLVSLALQYSFGNPFWFFFSVAVILSTGLAEQDLAGFLLFAAHWQ
jgi:hypothetical protein